MKYLLVLLCIYAAVFAGVKENMSKCKNWEEMKSLFYELKEDDYQLRYFYKNIESSTKSFSSKTLPNWLVDEVVLSIKSDDEYVIIEALKVASEYSLEGITGLDTLFMNAQKLCNSPVVLQSVILGYIANIRTASTNSCLRNIYLSRSQYFIMNPSFEKLYRLSLSRGVNTVEKDREFLDYAQSRVNLRNLRSTHKFQNVIDLITTGK